MYGVDWRDLGNPTLLRHHSEHNEDEGENMDDWETRKPACLSLVDVPSFECPFATDEQLQIFNDALLTMPEYHSRDMAQRQTVWSRALDLLIIILTP